MRFKITYNDSWADCDTIIAEEDEVFSIPYLSGSSGVCGGGAILNDADDEIACDITLYRGVAYVLRSDQLYAIIGRGRRSKEIPWSHYIPRW